MDLAYKFQQDTAKVINQLLPESIIKNELSIPRSEIMLRPIGERDTNSLQTGQANKISEVPRISAKAQLRNRWWQQEQKLLVGNSRYVNTNEEVRITTTEKIADIGLVLPNQSIKTENIDWLTILLIAILILFATVRTNYSKYMSQLVQSVLNYPTSARMYQEKNSSVAHGAFRLEVYFYLTFSVFLFQVLKYFNINLMYRNAGLYLFCFGLVVVYFLGKKLIYKFVGIVAERIDETGEYLFNMDNVNRIAGLVLFPVVLLVAYYPGEDPAIPVVTGIIVAFILYFMLIYRGTIILLKKQLSIFYLFLYFCTLEFLPLVLIYKIVVL